MINIHSAWKIVLASLLLQVGISVVVAMRPLTRFHNARSIVDQWARHHRHQSLVSNSATRRGSQVCLQLNPTRSLHTSGIFQRGPVVSSQYDHQQREHHRHKTRCWLSSQPDAAAAAASADQKSTTKDDNDASSKPEQQHSSYEHWVRRLYMTNMYNPVKLGLENIEKIHSMLGNPMDDVSNAMVILFNVIGFF